MSVSSSPPHAHPNAIRLEAFACGEAAPDVAAHVDQCAACRTFVDRARSAASEAPPAAVTALLASRVAKPRRRAFAPYAMAPLAAAAAVLLWMGHRVAPPPAPVESPASATTVAPPPSEEEEPETTFKGGLQLAVIRERDGAQARFTGTVRVRPGDRLRIEVAVDRPQSILGVVLGDDGTYVEMMADDVRPSGTHFSEKSARVDAAPLHGTILAGDPEAVRRARATGSHAGLAAIRVEWEPLP